MCEKWGEVCHTDLKEGEGLLIFMPENKHGACDWGGSAAVWRARNEVGHTAYGGAFSAVEKRQPLSLCARRRHLPLRSGGVKEVRNDEGVDPYGRG